MQNFEKLVSSLDEQILGVLESLNFSDSPLVWGNEVSRILSGIYESMARRTKEDIRAVARCFRGARRTNRLLYNLRDAVKRVDVLRVMLITVDLLTSSQSRVSRLGPDERSRIRADIPTLYFSLRSIMRKISHWQDEADTCLDIWSILEEPEETLGGLLASLPDNIPNVYVSQGQVLINRLVRLWAERRAIANQAVGLAPESQELQQLVDRLSDQCEDQRSIINSFAGLINQINDVPPLQLLNQEFTARQFSGANWVFRCLCIRRISIVEEMTQLETTLDHLMDVAEASQDAPHSLTLLLILSASTPLRICVAPHQRCCSSNCTSRPIELPACIAPDLRRSPPPSLLALIAPRLLRSRLLRSRLLRPPSTPLPTHIPPHLRRSPPPSLLALIAPRLLRSRLLRPPSTPLPTHIPPHLRRSPPSSLLTLIVPRLRCSRLLRSRLLRPPATPLPAHIPPHLCRSPRPLLPAQCVAPACIAPRLRLSPSTQLCICVVPRLHRRPPALLSASVARIALAPF
ncbi:hypothetical protein LXA43DRAFT_1102981 [Ganoderma leucocontextum]|nr:hypothetical protein LXA43DRAFT_1102981 [Ganoderma leucocontextum]